VGWDGDGGGYGYGLRLIPSLWGFFSLFDSSESDTTIFFFFDPTNPTRRLDGCSSPLRNDTRRTPHHTTYDIHHTRQWRRQRRRWTSSVRTRYSCRLPTRSDDDERTVVAMHTSMIWDSFSAPFSFHFFLFISSSFCFISRISLESVCV